MSLTSPFPPSNKYPVAAMTSYDATKDGCVTFDPKNMPFRRLGPTGLRVPLFSIGTCASYLITSPWTKITSLPRLQGSPLVVRLGAIRPKTSSRSPSRTESTCSILPKFMVAEAQSSSCGSQSFFHVIRATIHCDFVAKSQRSHHQRTQISPQ